MSLKGPPFSITVILDDSLSNTQIKSLANSITGFRGVIDAKVNLSSPKEQIADTRARHKYKQRINDFLTELNTMD